MSSSIETSKGGYFQCWVSGPGITVQNGYRPISFKGSKVNAHVFVWLYFNPGQVAADNNRVFMGVTAHVAAMII